MRAKPVDPLRQAAEYLQAEPEEERVLLSFVGGHGVEALLPMGYGTV